MKNNFYKLTLGLVFCSLAFKSNAQLNCGSSQMNQQVFNANPNLAADYAAHNAEISQLVQNRAPGDSTVYIIPVVFHIIHQNGQENISDAQIFDQINILNRDYSFGNYADTIGTSAGKIIPPFKNLAAECFIEFRLAQLDPNGNCTNGIDRIYSHKTNNADDGSKLNPWPRDKYLNVWVVATIGSQGVAGYAYYPSATSGPLAPADGILILHDYIGSIGTSATFSSRALTHEIGHYLNLQHPWGNNNDPGVACGDDGVNDTPPTKGHTACTSTDLYTPNCTVYPFIANKFDSLTSAYGTVDSKDTVVVTGWNFSDVSANGVGSATTANGKFSFNSWDSGAADAATTYASMTGTLNTSKYYEFTVAPESNAYAMNLTGITFTVERNATGPRTWAMRSSANNYATNLPVAITPANTSLSTQSTASVLFMNTDNTNIQKGSKFTLSGANYVNRMTPVTFRIYAYNAEDSTGTFAIDSLYVLGTAGLIENTQNYMDYSYCSKMYTQGQKDRMRAALQSAVSHRNNLWSAANLAATGVVNPTTCLSKADFYADKTRTCVNTVVKFTKNTLFGTPDSVRWTFYGGTPFTSNSSSSVNVTYANPGNYKVTLTTYNSAGTDSTTKVDYIRIDPSYGDIDYNGSYSETFEDASRFYGIWSISNYDNNNTWNRITGIGYQSNSSVKMEGFGNYQFDVDDLYTPSYDLSYTSGNIMTFRVAAASHGGSVAEVNDKLKVYVSKTCGSSWALLPSATFSDSTLINNGYFPTAFTPTSSSIWSLKTVTIPSIYNVSNVRFKFEYTTGVESNNIYLDNLNITGVVGIDESSNATSSLSIYPNPSNESSTIAYHLNKKANTRVEVLDVLGKAVFVQSNSGQAEGDYTVQISKQSLNLKNGIYFVKFSVDNKSTTKKLVITE
jgi:PKD repeat protein